MGLSVSSTATHARRSSAYLASTLDRARFVISDVVQPEVPIALCRRPLDVTKGGQVSLDRRQDLLAVHGPLV